MSLGINILNYDKVGRHFADGIFKLFSWTKRHNFIQVSLKIVVDGPIDDKSASPEPVITKPHDAINSFRQFGFEYYPSAHAVPNAENMLTLLGYTP